MIIIIEIFGSPFMRNASLVLALLIGVIVSAIVKVDGKSFLTADLLNASPAITFLWTKRFPLGEYGSDTGTADARWRFAVQGVLHDLEPLSLFLALPFDQKVTALASFLCRFLSGSYSSVDHRVHHHLRRDGR